MKHLPFSFRYRLVLCEITCPNKEQHSEEDRHEDSSRADECGIEVIPVGLGINELFLDYGYHRCDDSTDERIEHHSPRVEDEASHVLHDEYDSEDGRDEASDSEVGSLVHSDFFEKLFHDTLF